MKKQYLRLGAIAVLGLFVLGALAMVGFAGVRETLTALFVGAVPIVFGMILDDRLEFADALALSTAGTVRILIGDVIDTTQFRNIGSPPRPLYLVIQVDTAVTSGGAATVEFILASDAQAAIAVDGTATEHMHTQAIPKATLVAGFTMVIPLAGEKPAYERFVGILQLTNVAVLTAGKINAFLTHDPKQWKAYPDAI